MSNVERVPRGAAAKLDRGLDVAMRIVPVAVLVAIGALFAAGQAVKPHHRAIKLGVMLGLAAFMFRFDMVYSVYLFTFLFVFPTGISIASSNSVLMTVIPMIWAVRAASTRVRLFRPTALDAPHAVFVLAYVLSFMNVDRGYLVVAGLKVVWRQLACLAYFYMIVTFVDSREKLERLLKVICVTVTLVMLTGLLESFAPGAVIIPGWIDMTRPLREGGLLAARSTKIRVAGSIASDANLSDFGSAVFAFLAYFAWKARNPAEKAFWSMATAVTLVGVLSTGNRGGLIEIMIAMVYGMYLFRRKMSFRRLTLTVTAVFALMFAATYLLDRYTYATSPIKRLEQTKMVGFVPETRTMTWKPSLEKSLQHPFFGHGPFFEIGEGLTYQFWPHNGYLFYLQTLGLFGLSAFLWIMVRTFKMTLVHRRLPHGSHPVGDLMALAHVWWLVFAVGQLRTDHQRDDIYPYMVWLMFGVIVAAAQLIQAETAQAEEAVEGVPGSPA